MIKIKKQKLKTQPGLVLGGGNCDGVLLLEIRSSEIPSPTPRVVPFRIRNTMAVPPLIADGTGAFLVCTRGMVCLEEAPPSSAALKWPSPALPAASWLSPPASFQDNRVVIVVTTRKFQTPARDSIFDPCCPFRRNHTGGSSETCGAGRRWCGEDIPAAVGAGVSWRRRGG